jgi:hypothetical protein
VDLKTAERKDPTKIQATLKVGNQTVVWVQELEALLMLDGIIDMREDQERAKTVLKEAQVAIATTIKVDLKTAERKDPTKIQASLKVGNQTVVWVQELEALLMLDGIMDMRKDQVRAKAVLKEVVEPFLIVKPPVAELMPKAEALAAATEPTLKVEAPEAAVEMNLTLMTWDGRDAFLVILRVEALVAALKKEALKAATEMNPIIVRLVATIALTSTEPTEVVFLEATFASTMKNGTRLQSTEAQL